MRLPTWVVVVLILTLFASCSAASDAASFAGRAVDGAGSQASASEADVRDLCRLLGSLATAQGVDLEEVFADGATSGCSEAALGSAGP